jgi:hypothetical protein
MKKAAPTEVGDKKHRGEACGADSYGDHLKPDLWIGGHALLVGAILHILYAEMNKTLAGVAAFLFDSKPPDRSDAASHDDDVASRGPAASGRRVGRP